VTARSVTGGTMLEGSTRAARAVRLALVLSAWFSSACGARGGAPGTPPLVAPSVSATAPLSSVVTPSAPSTGSIEYPKARRSDVVDDYHGVRVADPYRWLEDPDSAETRAWVEAENRVTFAYLDQIPERSAIERRLTALWNYERYGVPERRGGSYFYTRNDGLQNQSVLYVASRLDAAPRVLVDPNALAADGTVSLTGYVPSNDGRWLAYGLARAGSDWTEWRVLDVRTAADLPDRLEWIKFSRPAWTRDGRGFFYSRFPEPAKDPKVAATYGNRLYFHRLGDPQDRDALVYERPEHKEWMFHPEVTEDGRYLVVFVSKSSDDKEMVLFKRLSPRAPAEGSLVDLVPDFTAEYAFVGSRGSRLWFKTDRDASRGRVVSVDVERTPRAWEEIVPEGPDALDAASWVGDRLFLTYLVDAHSEVRMFDPSGRFERKLPLPGLASVRGFSGRQSDTETFYAITSFATPGAIHRYETRSGQDTVFRSPRVDFDPENYVTEQVFVSSKDGTRVPVFLSRRKDVAPNASTPAYLYGYGGFAISIVPWFDPSALLWMEMGGLYAVANLRGGGEYGTAWHEAAMKSGKQRVFDDFIAAAEWLVAHGYTSPGKLAIGGRSNGGLLVGACLTQHPELFGAALPAVGVLDMLRYHRFTIGWAWADEYGTAESETDFRALYGYSPLHNVRPGTRYPATLVTTADHDDRVVPAHSFKFAAALQTAQAGPAPVLVRIETDTGHGAGVPTRKLIREQADRWAFLVRTLGFRPALR
jgi:prolyl oligopeptidase